jgi:hypothetical protein
MAWSIGQGYPSRTGAEGRESCLTMMLLEKPLETRMAAIKSFVAANALRPGCRVGGRVLGTVGWNFARHFLGIVETDVAESMVHAWTLGYTAEDRWILKETGWRAESALRVADVHDLMALGDQGPCHLKGESNFTYMLSPVDNRPWAVHWFINGDGEWIVGAAYVPHPALDWRSGSRVFAGRTVLRKAADAAAMRH